MAPARALTSRDEEIFDVIRQRGGRVTAPTRLVVSVLLDTDAHLTADDLIDAVSRRKKGVAPSTVYRVLQRLGEVGVVEHVHPGDGPAFYHLRARRAMPTSSAIGATP